MKANELRIGNWFIEYDEPQQFDGDFYHLIDIKPIPLTEEWLLKLGFYSCETNACYTKYIYTNSRSRVKNWVVKLFNGTHTNGSRRYGNKLNKYYWDKIELKHVHQLQNLYFALTGEELTIKQS
jgi:hypothetical protein